MYLSAYRNGKIFIGFLVGIHNDNHVSTPMSSIWMVICS